MIFQAFSEAKCTVPRINGHSKSERTARDSAMGYDSTSVMSSELESSSFIDSEEDEDASRLSSSTDQSLSSQLMRRHKRRRRRHKVAKIDRSSSFSSITDSTMHYSNNPIRFQYVFERLKSE
ncbi:segment polarity protein dishevelled homolog DVL-3-like [Salmo trutta]|uniref:segment polarity protein dishevelled homolog DVL-3-like n=1 Tax=Salmo trutta TaxID=8032 RepID=UPI0011301CCA|nr:segment polarity protein dishevelled homolog DVL-3-like [Salmo trutta]